MQTLWQDLRYAVRILSKKPGFTLIAVLSLALGIGANIVIFTLVNAVLFRTAPVAEPNRLVFVFNGNQNNPWSSISYPNYVDYRDRNEVFEGLGAFNEISISLSRDDHPDLVRGLIVTGNFFDVLGVKPTAGRTFRAEEDQTPNTHPVAVISHNLLQQRFGGASDVIGQELSLNGNQFTLIGIAAAGFKGPDVLENFDVYVPMMMQTAMRPPRAGFSGEMSADLLSKRSGGWLRMIGRLKPGVSLEQAQASLSTLAAQLEEVYPEINRGKIATLFPLTKVDPRAYNSLVGIATLMMAVVGIVLLIACANVANLMLAQASARRKEIAVRLALGASRLRLLRQLLSEGLLLSILGGVSGLLLAVWAIDILHKTAPTTGIFSFNLDYQIDTRVLAFTFGLSVLTAVVFGLAPAWQSSNPDIVPVLKDETYARVGARRRFNLRSALVIAQMALSLMLLIGAGLFLSSLRQAQKIDPGFDAEKILITTLNINLLRYTKPQGREFYRQVIDKVEALPGIQSASLARHVPISGSGRTESLAIEGQPFDQQNNQQPAQASVAANILGLRYFQTMGIALQRGRDFEAQDDEGTTPVVIVNETFARRYYPEQDAIGKRISVDGAQGPWREIVGVVRDSKYRNLSEDPTPFVYRPLSQNHETGMTLHVRTTGDPAIATEMVRREIQALEKNLPLTDLQPLTTLFSSALFPARMGALLIIVFGLLALLLAAIGLYGVMAYTVAQRTREIGVRVALGAQRRDVLRLVIGQGMKLSLMGVALGLVSAFVLTRLLESLLFGTSATDATIFILVSLLLTGVALVACLVPARRAMKVDPMVALRYE